MQSPSKTHQDLDAFPMLPEGEVSKLTDQTTLQRRMQEIISLDKDFKDKPRSFQDLQT